MGGEPFSHLLFQFCCRVGDSIRGDVHCAGERTSGSAVGAWRPDLRHLSAATHDLKDSHGRAFNESYSGHTRPLEGDTPRSSHENGVAEQGHRRLKDAIAQALVLRGSSDFESVEAAFVVSWTGATGLSGRSWHVSTLTCARCLPLRCQSTSATAQGAQVEHHQGEQQNILGPVPSDRRGGGRSATGHIEVYYKGHLVESMERIRGGGEARIDYRHIIGSLVRKPGAFARYRFREQMYPSHTFRLAYDAMHSWKGERADVDQHLAATGV